MAIRILEPNVAAQIAAGEVVERPASVVRELIENALDAGARRITIDLYGGGLRELRVQDDGTGIAAADVELAFQRHATSKITQADDLWSIATLGFRGEALPSIASVAQVVCITRTAQESVGVELRIAGGEIQGRTLAACLVGTSISIRNLFYNTPVRREFLRSEASEAAATIALINQYAIAYPEVRYTAALDGRVVLQTSGDGDLRNVLIELYGLDLTRQLLPVALQQGDGLGFIQLQGLIAPPGLTRSSRSGLHICINRRVIQPRGPVAMVIEEAYHTLLAKGRHPLAALNITVHPAAIDVNIHPTKSEVKFRDAPRVLGAIGRAVRDALLESGAALWDAASAPGIDTVAQRRFELRQIGSQWSDSPSMDSLNQPESWLGDMAAQIPFQGVIPDPHPIELPMPSLADIRLLGQVQGAYIVAEAPNGICLIHQHVAHTRILYEQIQRQHADGSLVAQAREVSLTLEMPELAQSLLLQHASLLAEYGFAIEDFGMALRVRALPAILAPEYAAPTFAAIAGLLRQAGEQHVVVALLAIPIAEQAALRSGQRLEPPEMLALLADLARCQQPYRCPRGHPTLILLSADHLASWFGLEH